MQAFLAFYRCPAIWAKICNCFWTGLLDFLLCFSLEGEKRMAWNKQFLGHGLKSQIKWPTLYNVMGNVLARPLPIGRTIGRRNETNCFHFFRKVLVMVTAARSGAVILLP